MIDKIKEKLANWFAEQPLRYLLIPVGTGLLLILALYSCSASAAPTLTITVSPTTGISPATTTVTWSSTEVTACTASGGWTGAKAPSGSVMVSGLLVSTTFNLTCTGAANSAVLSWVPPTQNSDGSALTNLAKYTVHHAATSAGVASATGIDVIAPATGYTVTGLPVGMRYFGVRSVNSDGVSSILSSIVSKDIQLTTVSGSATFNVQTRPNPPTVITVSTLAFDLTRTGKIGTIVGKIARGVPCLGDVVKTRLDGSTFYEVPREAVTLTKIPRSDMLVAKCAPQQS